MAIEFRLHRPSLVARAIVSDVPLPKSPCMLPRVFKNPPLKDGRESVAKIREIATPSRRENPIESLEEPPKYASNGYWVGFRLVNWCTLYPRPYKERSAPVGGDASGPSSDQDSK